MKTTMRKDVLNSLKDGGIKVLDCHTHIGISFNNYVATGDDGFQADYADPASVLAELAETYPGTIIWGTDTPYHYFAQKFLDQDGNLQDCRLMAPYDAEIKILRAIPKNAANEIAYENILKYLQ
ncbi:MAG: hypothetical protein GXP32_07280 [Kiritimatiellaeota bacterium]|nr:hypothetical protein [Kiritimatiellota bacterium]